VIIGRLGRVRHNRWLTSDALRSPPEPILALDDERTCRRSTNQCVDTETVEWMVIGLTVLIIRAPCPDGWETTPLSD